MLKFFITYKENKETVAVYDKELAKYITEDSGIITLTFSDNDEGYKIIFGIANSECVINNVHKIIIDDESNDDHYSVTIQAHTGTYQIKTHYDSLLEVITKTSHRVQYGGLK